MNDVVKLALDAHHNRVNGNFSYGETMDTLREALIEANGGSTKLDYKRIRDGKCNGLFSIIEETLQVANDEGIRGDELFMTLVDYRNRALGDETSFYIPDNSYFVVSEVAAGTQALRRQRLNAGTNIDVPTKVYGLKIYEELDRVLSNRIDFNEFIDRANKSYVQKTRNDIFTLWNTLAASNIGGTTYYPVKGTYSEDALLELIAHVEAATGRSATIFGTQKGLKKVKTTELSEEAKSNLLNFGFYGKFYSTPMVVMKQAHKLGTNDFLLDDNKIYVMATGDKPIKFVSEGSPTILMGDPTANMDFTQEFTYIDRYGIALAVADKFGIYETN